MDVPLIPVMMAVASSLGTRIRVHIIAGYDVDPNISGGSTTFGTLTSSNRDSGLATAIMKQINISIAKMSVGQAIDDIMETRFTQSNPECIVKDLIRYGCHPSVS